MHDATAKPLRIALIAQNRLTCDSIASALQHDPSIPTDVCYLRWGADTDGASEAGHPARADAAIILHHHQPDINCTLESLRFLRNHIPDRPVCAVIPQAQPALMARNAQTLLNNGCRGLLTGDVSVAELKVALTTTRAGYYLSASARKAIIDAARDRKALMLLSEAEFRIVSAVITAGDRREIPSVARRLGLSTKTIYAHLYRIADRHNLPHNVGEIIKYWSGKLA